MRATDGENFAVPVASLILMTAAVLRMTRMPAPTMASGDGRRR